MTRRASVVPADPPVVLVLEGEPETRDRLTLELLARRFVVVPAADRAQTEVLCDSVEPDVVLLNLDELGDEAAGLLGRLRTRRPRARLVAVTREAGAARAGCTALGAGAILDTPGAPGSVADALLDLLRRPGAVRPVVPG